MLKIWITDDVIKRLKKGEQVTYENGVNVAYWKGNQPKDKKFTIDKD